jgi:exodeoxyribonuclease VII large subunit
VEEVCRGIEYFSRTGWADLVIVGRGGGSLEDLWTFNEEAVARAIAASSVPVISAVGHETDVTIADFVADLRAPTPSAAAELVVRNKTELVQNLGNLGRRLSQVVRALLESRGERLSSLIHRLADPRKRLSDQRLRLDDLSYRLSTSMLQGLRQRSERLRMKYQGLIYLHPGRRVAELLQRLTQLCRRLALAGRASLRSHRQGVEVLAGRLQTLSPLAVLERGYSIARLLPARRIIREASLLKTDDRVIVRVHRGEFTARVEKAGEEEAPQPSLTLKSKGV